MMRLERGGGVLGGKIFTPPLQYGKVKEKETTWGQRNK